MKFAAFVVIALLGLTGCSAPDPMALAVSNCYDYLVNSTEIPPGLTDSEYAAALLTLRQRCVDESKTDPAKFLSAFDKPVPVGN